jgi:hypothetical protein
MKLLIEFLGVKENDVEAELEHCMGESEYFLVFKDSGYPVPHADL